MKTVIVYAHPQTPGHCPEILKEVEAYHKEHGIEYELLDLYKMKYDPVLHENEHYTAGEGHWDVSKENKRIRQLILDNNKLIFIYPVWWNSMPAVLKGFIDKVFTAHFAFKFVTMPVISKIMGGIPRPLLKGKKAVVFLTTGSNWIAWWFFLRRRARKLMLTDILGFFGIKARVYHLGSCRIVDEGRILKIKKMVAKGLAGF